MRRSARSSPASSRRFRTSASTLRRLYLRDDLIVQEWTATATHANPVRYRDTVLAPTGRTARWDGVDIIPVQDGKVARKDVYANSLGYLRGLGAAV